MVKANLALNLTNDFARLEHRDFPNERMSKTFSRYMCKTVGTRIFQVQSSRATIQQLLDASLLEHTRIKRFDYK